MHALILNSGMGSRMGTLTSVYPKCMTEISEQETILSRQLRQLHEADIEKIIITTGKYSDVLVDYCKNIDNGQSIQYVYNYDYRNTNYIYSIYCAREYLKDDIILLHGDLVLEDGIIEEMVAQEKSCMAVSSKVELPQKDFKAVVHNGKIIKIGIEFFDHALAAQPIYKLLKKDWEIWLDKIECFCKENNKKCYAENAFNEVSDRCELGIFDVENRLCNEIDDYNDLLFVTDKLKKTEAISMK